jgi:hypothetical protein
MTEQVAQLVIDIAAEDRASEVLAQLETRLDTLGQRAIQLPFADVQPAVSTESEASVPTLALGGEVLPEINTVQAALDGLFEKAAEPLKLSLADPQFVSRLNGELDHAARARTVHIAVSWSILAGGQMPNVAEEAVRQDFEGSLPRRAAGGPVSAGQPYLVGEQGMEVFVPSSGGYIVPNHGLDNGSGGSGATHIHIHGNIYGPDDLNRHLQDARLTGGYH